MPLTRLAELRFRPGQGTSRHEEYSCWSSAGLVQFSSYERQLVADRSSNPLVLGTDKISSGMHEIEHLDAFSWHFRPRLVTKRAVSIVDTCLPMFAHGRAREFPVL